MIRFTDGAVTVTLDGALEQFVRAAVDAAAGETVRVMERAANEVATEAKADWYDPSKGVTKRTGASGALEVITTVSEREVRVSLGSLDLAKAKFVHRPGPLSTVAVEITADEYAKAKRLGGIGARLVFHAKKAEPTQKVEAGKYYRKAANPLAADGKYLVVELVRKPMIAKVRAITPELGRAIAARAGGR